MRTPVRHVLAIDGGSRRFKLLLAETDFGRFRVLKQELIDLQAEGLVSPEEIKTHLHACLQHWGQPALALTLPSIFRFPRSLICQSPPKRRSKNSSPMKVLNWGESVKAASFTILFR